MKKVIPLFSFVLFALGVRAQNVGIGTTSPAAKLDIIGNIKITDGTEGAGKVLTSDGTGTATWQAATAAASQTGGVGYGAWGDCSTRNISGYNPVTASDGVVNDYFGSGVSVSGNYAIVGSPEHKVGVNNQQGKAYIYYYNGTTWVQQATLTATDGANGDGFGTSVSISGNYAIVGANSKTVGTNIHQGKVYIYYYNGTTWSQQAALTAGDGATDDDFGISVSLSGNLAVVGADGKNTSQGKAYIYYYNGTTWSLLNTVTASDGAFEDKFGSSTSINGSLVIVGASNKKVGTNSGQGKAYIYYRSGITLVQQAALVEGDGAQSDYFGNSVSISGNYAIVGAYEKNQTPNGTQGAAYIYYYNGTTWFQQAKLYPIVGAGLSGALFGFSVNISGNYAIVGAVNENVGANNTQGVSYIYINDGIRWRQLQQVTDPGGAASDYFGNSVSIDGSRFLIGAPGVQGNLGMAFFGKVEQ